MKRNFFGFKQVKIFVIICSLTLVSASIPAMLPAQEPTAQSHAVTAVEFVSELKAWKKAVFEQAAYMAKRYGVTYSAAPLKERYRELLQEVGASQRDMETTPDAIHHAFHMNAMDTTGIFGISSASDQYPMAKIEAAISYVQQLPPETKVASSRRWLQAKETWRRRAGKYPEELEAFLRDSAVRFKLSENIWIAKEAGNAAELSKLNADAAELARNAMRRDVRLRIYNKFPRIPSVTQIDSEAELQTLTFTQLKARRFIPLTEIPYFTNFYVEAHFDSEPYADEFGVTLSFEAADPVTVTVTKTLDPEVFRSEKLQIDPVPEDPVFVDWQKD